MMGGTLIGRLHSCLSRCWHVCAFNVEHATNQSIPYRVPGSRSSITIRPLFPLRGTIFEDLFLCCVVVVSCRVLSGMPLVCVCVCVCDVVLSRKEENLKQKKGGE